MLRLRSFFFAMVLALVGAQSWNPAEPRPVKARYSSGSYSSFPGRIPKPPPINDPEFGPPGNGQSNVPQDTKSFSAVKSNSGTVVIPASSSSYSSFPGQFRQQETSVLSQSFSAAQRNTVPETKPVQPNIYSSTETRGGQGGSFSDVAASELAQGIKKPISPKSTGTDTWTPMGHLGTGQPWNPMSADGTQQLPYDTTQSSLTIGEQIMQKQLQEKQQLPHQQQQQQYNVFGLPLNSAPDPFANLFGMTPAMGGLFSPLSAPQDPFFGMFGGASTGTGNTAGSGQGGNFLQMMLLMQLLGGGADAPDPQPPSARGGRLGVGPSLTPASALDQLIRLEEMRAMRNRQSERVSRNRLPQNRRHGTRQDPFQHSVQERQQSRHAAAASNFDTTNTLAGPAPSRLPHISNRRQKSSPNRRVTATRTSLHPEVLDRRNMPTTPAPTPQGQEPIEREGPSASGQTSNQGQNVAPTGTPARDFERQRPRSYNAQYPHSARQGNNLGYQSYNTFEHPAWGGNQQNNFQANRGQNFGQRPRGRNGVPRNIQQLVNNHLFQRRLRVAGSTPGANPADVRADQADLMADRADNMQAMGPLNMLLNSGMYGGMGMSGFGGLQSNSGLSPLANLFGSGGGTGGLSALSMLRGGNSDLELKRNGDYLEINIRTTLEKSDTNGRHRRQAIIYDGSETFHDHSSHFHPPKPPKLEDATPRSRRPPPPPKKVYQSQIVTTPLPTEAPTWHSHVKVNRMTSQPKPMEYPDIKRKPRGRQSRYPEAVLRPSDPYQAESQFLGVQNNLQPERSSIYSGGITQDVVRQHPEYLQSSQHLYPEPMVQRTYTKAPIVRTERITSTMKPKPNNQLYFPTYQQSGIVDQSFKSATVGNRHHPITKNPQQHIKSTGSSDLGALLGDVNALLEPSPGRIPAPSSIINEHVGHPHSHADIHSNVGHTSANVIASTNHATNGGQQQGNAVAPNTHAPNNVNVNVAATNNHETNNAGSPLKNTDAPVVQHKTPAEAVTMQPKPEPQAGNQDHFMTMFDAWYKTKFEAAAKPPSPSPVPVQKLYVTETPIRPKVITGIPVKLRPVMPNQNAVFKGGNIREMILRPEGIRHGHKRKRLRTNTSERPNLFRQSKKVPSQSDGQGQTIAGPKPIDKQALFQEFMLMYKKQFPENGVGPPTQTTKTASSQKQTSQTKQATNATQIIPAPTAAAPITNAGHIELVTLSHPETFQPHPEGGQALTSVPANAKTQGPPVVSPEGAAANAEPTAAANAEPSPSANAEGAAANAEASPVAEGAAANAEASTAANAEAAPVANAEGAAANAEANPAAEGEGAAVAESEGAAAVGEAPPAAPAEKKAPAPRPVKKAPVKATRPRPTIRTTTPRPTIDPDLLADINEARMAQGLPLLQSSQVDEHGNPLPFYNRQMRVGRLPARPHPLRNPSRLNRHHPLREQNGRQNRHHPRQDQNVLNTLTSMFQGAAHEGGEGPMMHHQRHRNGPPRGPHKFNLFNSHFPGNRLQGPPAFNNMHAPHQPVLDNLELQHQAMHFEAGANLNPNIHRQLHQLLRQRQQVAQRSGLFAGLTNPSATRQPIFDPDLMSDLMDAAASRNG